MIILALQIILSNFPMSMFVLSVLLALFSYKKFSSVFLNSLLFLCVGLGGAWGFVMHTFFSEITTKLIGWQPSPFEFEVALANLALGLVGIIAVFANNSFKSAVVIVTTVFLWGAATGHVHQIIAAHNFNPGNAGTILWTDILIPLCLILALVIVSCKNRPEKGSYITNR